MPDIAAAPVTVFAAERAEEERSLLSSTRTIEAQAQVTRQPSSTAVSLPASLACVAVAVAIEA
eukprot:18142-Heterococcus_DN1.PRE.3